MMVSARFQAVLNIDVHSTASRITGSIKLEGGILTKATRTQIREGAMMENTIRAPHH